ncbi:MAG: ATP-binding protein [Campylobacterota bacterium]|nr:ATP-binding protein [Campylobacterota bacterium]
MKTLDTDQIQSELTSFTKNLELCDKPNEINTILESLIVSLVGSEFASIWIYDQKNALLNRKRDSNFRNEISINTKKGILYKVFMTKKPAIYNNFISEEEYDEFIDNPDSINIKTKIIIPLIEEGELIGVATAYSSIEKHQEFTTYDFKVFNIIIPYIMDAICKIKGCVDVDRSQKELKNIDTTIQEIQELKSSPEIFNYLSSVVHDIKIPVNNLYGFLELLEEKIDDPRLKYYIDNAKDSTQFINTLSDSILAHDTQSQEDNLHQKFINSVSYFSKISEIFVSNMYNKEISFNVFIDPLIPKEIKIDSLKLKRIIMNLLENAYKFTQRNRCIEFSVKYEQKNKKISISIKDNGIGISRLKQKEILDDFKLMENYTDSQTYHGNNLGLAICAYYTKDLNGSLKMESTIYKGSTFYFDIPIELKSHNSTFRPIKNSNAKISILMDNKNSCSANNIARHIIRLGFEQKQIKAIMSIDDIDKDTTHLISFQNRVSLEVILFCGRNKIENLIVEEKLFSISRNQENCTNLIISQYGYFTDILYSFISIDKTPRVLIVDDNRINIALLKGILSEELSIIESANSMKKALDMIEQAIMKDRAYNFIYIDNFISDISCNEVLNRLRALEDKNSLERTKVISTSNKKDDSDNHYDFYVTKPFKKDEIRGILTSQI